MTRLVPVTGDSEASAPTEVVPSADNSTTSPGFGRWMTVIVGALAGTVGAGVVTVSVGAFIKPITADFGWDRSVMNYALALWAICSGVGSIFLGRFMHRWGVRKPTAIMLLIYALTLAAIPFVRGSLPLLFAISIISGFSGSAATAMPYSVAICRLFDQNRGLALSLLVSGGGIGFSILPRFASEMLDAYGWRISYLALAFLVGVISLVAIMLVRIPEPVQEEPVERPSSNWHDMKEILGDWRFWSIASAVFSVAVIGAVAYPNLMPMMTDRGMSVASVVTLLSAAGAATYASRLLVGPAMDRVHAPYVGAVVLLCMVVGVALLLFPVPWTGRIIGAALIGAGIGGEAEIVTFTASRYFSAPQYSRVVGMIWAFWAWGMAIASVIVGMIFDSTGNYDLALIISAASALVGIPALLFLGPYRYARTH